MGTAALSMVKLKFRRNASGVLTKFCIAPSHWKYGDADVVSEHVPEHRGIELTNA